MHVAARWSAPVAAIVMALCSAAAAPPATQPARAPSTEPSTQPATRTAAANPPAPGFDRAGSDERAIAVADATMAAMGGRDAWDATRYITWNFFGGRHHLWDRATNRLRIEGASGKTGQWMVILMDLDDGSGRAWLDGAAVDDSAERAELLDGGREWWINDSYWLLMPYKLKDGGVTLRYVGERFLAPERPADVIDLTFTGVGRTPQNRYHVWVARDSGLVERWEFFHRASDEAPRFETPWTDWRRYGAIMLSGDRGTVGGERMVLTGIGVFDELPAELFDDPRPLDWPAFAAGGADRRADPPPWKQPAGTTEP